MKSFVFAFAVLLAGVAALPDETKINERFVDNIVANIIEDISITIKENGWDPGHVPHASFEYKLPVTELLVVNAALEELHVEGLSNIFINSISFSLFTSRLQLVVSLPLVSAKLGSASSNVKLFSTNLGAEASGSLAIEDLRVDADVRLNLFGVISGNILQSLEIDFTLKAIHSDLDIIVLGRDVSEPINKFLGETITDTLEAHRTDINSLLEHVLTDIINGLL